MKKVLFILFAALLTLPFVSAQLPWDITDLRCHNSKLDQFEMCDKGVAYKDGFCDDLADLLGIDNNCDERHCTCVPKINMVYCGNNRRESVEICDGSGENLCGNLSVIMNLSLVCNPKTCGCAINGTLPTDYNPAVISGLQNASQKPSVCGDKKVERAEDCDPPNTLCTTNTKEPGVCTEKCKCMTAAQLAQGSEEPAQKEEQGSSQANETKTESNVSEPVESHDEPKTEGEPGFFSRMWAWIVGLFS